MQHDVETRKRLSLGTQLNINPFKYIYIYLVSYMKIFFNVGEREWFKDKTEIIRE